MKPFCSSPLLYLFVCLVGLLSLVGCGERTGDLDAMEEEHPDMEKALSLKRAQDYEGAILVYETILEREPRTAKAHLQLGLLYDEFQQDYIRAVYHYQKYLALRPEAEKGDMIEELIRAANLAYAASLPDRPSNAVQEIAALKVQIKALEKDLTASRDRIRDLSEAVRRYQARSGTAGAGDRVQAAGSESTSEDGYETYYVKAGDNLSRIAKKVYKDSGKWRRIYEANRDVLKNPEDLTLGQALRIPR